VVEILYPEGLSAFDTHTVIIGGVTNPRSFKPTGNFFMQTLDIDKVSPIDIGFNAETAMTQPGPITGASLVKSNYTNGVTQDMTISVAAEIPVIPTDKFVFDLPQPNMAPPSADAMDCQPVTAEDGQRLELTCTVDGDHVEIIFDEFEGLANSFTFELHQITNAPSTKPNQFTLVELQDAEGYTVSGFPVLPTTVNRYPRWIQTFDMDQDVKDHSEPATYTITFTPVNPIPAAGSIQIASPNQVTLQSGVSTCEVEIDGVVLGNSGCVIDTDTRLITIKGIFTNGFDKPIKIILKKLINPANNRPDTSLGFVIQTYLDGDQQFLMDKVHNVKLMPKFNCEWPCQTCRGNEEEADRKFCTDCWRGNSFKQFLMPYAENDEQTCREYCDPGFTRNDPSSTNYVCEACDVSCETCYPSSKTECIKCSETHPFRNRGTNTCLEKCARDFFISSVNICSQCALPCKSCVDTESKCTSCHATEQSPDFGLVPNLFENKCIDVCPEQYVSMRDLENSGFCTRCKMPCNTCEDRPENCVTCDETAQYFYQKRCYADCPRGSTTIVYHSDDDDQADPNAAPPAVVPNTPQQVIDERPACKACPVGCDLCDSDDTSICLECTAPTVSMNGKCLDKCPEGWHVNFPDGEGRACRLWKLGDAGTAPYPFLICFGIFVVIILFGLMKRHAYIYKGLATMKSPQSTITCIIVAGAPLQFLACLAQWIFAFIYGTPIFTILTAIVFLGAVIINIVWHCHFLKRFDSQRLSIEDERKVRLNKISRAKAMKENSEPCDEDFAKYKKLHKCSVNTIYVFSVMLSMKINMAFYCFFYDLQQFKATLSDPKNYRKMLTWYTIATIICIDMALICIDITCLTMIEDDNQLWITVIETLVLSIILLVLSAVELYMIKDNLKYTTKKRDKLKIKHKDSDESDSWSEYDNLDKKFDQDKMSERRLLMSDLLRHVKHNKMLFLNNKLDELLNAFGNRKCKSMLDLGTGWPLEDDPRLAITWPCSPALREDYAEQFGEDFKFTKEDAYGVQGNNVYADVKSKFMGMDFGTQDDAGFLEF
jgi:hypothetical protein